MTTLPHNFDVRVNDQLISRIGAKQTVPPYPTQRWLVRTPMTLVSSDATAVATQIIGSIMEQVPSTIGLLSAIVSYDAQVFMVDARLLVSH